MYSKICRTLEPLRDANDVVLTKIQIFIPPNYNVVLQTKKRYVKQEKTSIFSCDFIKHKRIVHDNIRAGCITLLNSIVIYKLPAS